MKYWSNLTLADVSPESDGWVQVLSVGKVKHQLYGTIDLSQQRLQKFIENFKSKVRGTELDVDYDHKMDPSKGRKAAGWIKDLQLRSNGLWAKIEWTEEARQEIKNGHYKYISADFHDSWTDQEGKEHNDVLAGAGITNRPFLKDMVPINLTDILNKEDGMDPELRKALIAKYQLSENATDADIQKAVNDDSTKTEDAVDLSKATINWSDDKKTATITIPGAEGEVKVQAPEPVQASEPDEDRLKKLAEDNPELAQLLAEREEDRKRLSRLENANRLSEVSQQLSEVEGLPPVVLTELREALVTAPKTFSDKVVGAIKTLKEKGFVPSTQVSGGGGPSGEDATGSPDAIKNFLEAVDKVREKDTKLSEADAYDKVATENPQLYIDYDQAVRSGQTQFQEG